MNSQALKLGNLIERIKTVPGPAHGQCVKCTKTMGPVFSKVLAQVANNAKKAVLTNSPAALIGKNNKPDNWLHQFRSLLLSKGIPLDKTSLTSDAIPDLKSLLISQGVPEKTADQILSEIFGGPKKGKITIPQLFEKLSQIGVRSKKTEDSLVVEISVVPHIETMLRSMGLSAHQAKTNIERARVNAGELDLKKLVTNLKEAISELSPETLKKTTALPSDTIRLAFAEAGIKGALKDLSEQMSLARFVEILENKIAQIQSPLNIKSDTTEQVAQLLNHISFDGKNLKTAKNVHSQKKASNESPVTEKSTEGNIVLDGGEKQVVEFVPGKSKAKSQGRHGKFQGRENVDALKASGKGSVNDNQHNVATGTNSLGGEKEFEAQVQETQRGQQESFQQTVHDGVRNSSTTKTQGRGEIPQSNSGEKVDNSKAEVTMAAAKDAVSGNTSKATVEVKPARPLPMYVANQVAMRIGHAVKTGQNLIRLNLNPPHLGAVQLKLLVKNDGLNVSMVAENQAVREMLLSHMQELRESLLQQGVQLNQVDVDVAQQFNNSMANAQQESADNGNRNNSRGQKVDTGQDDIHEHLDETVVSRRAKNGLLDMFA